MKKESLKLQAYSHIKTKILNCEYAPNTFLNEDMLGEEINASRTPIRDALSRLEQEGLIKILPKKGIVVSGLTINEINKIYETRILLECYAIKNYGAKISYEDYMVHYNNFKNIVETSNYEGDNIFEIDDSLHKQFINATENHYFIQTYNYTHSQNYRLRILSGIRHESRIKDSSLEHLRIVEYCLKNDFNSASKEMEAHLVTAKNSAFEVILKDPKWLI